MNDLADLELRALINRERAEMLRADVIRLARRTMELADTYEALVPERRRIRQGRTENMARGTARGTVWKLTK